MVQIYQSIGYEGGLFRSEGGLSTVGTSLGYVNAMATTMPYARVVVAGTNPGDLILPSATDQVPQGFTFQNLYYESDASGVAGIPADMPVVLLKRGAVWFVAEDDVEVTDTVYFRHTANTTPGANQAIGRVRSDADTDKADALGFGSKFLLPAKAGELVPVWADFGG